MAPARRSRCFRDQATLYRALFNAFNRPSVTSVTTWGMADNHTWLNRFPVTRTNRPLLFDTAGDPKWAFWAVVDPNDRRFHNRPRETQAITGKPRGIHEGSMTCARRLPRPDVRCVRRRGRRAIVTVTHDLDAARPAEPSLPFHSREIARLAPELRMYHVVVRDREGPGAALADH